MMQTLELILAMFADYEPEVVWDPVTGEASSIRVTLPIKPVDTPTKT